MVTLNDLLQLIYDELKTVAVNAAGVSDPDQHVGVLDRTKDIETPFFGFEWNMSPNDIGMGGNVRVVNINTTGGNIDSVDRARDYEIFVDFGVVVDGDNVALRDQYLNAVQDHFVDFVDDTRTLHDHVKKFRYDGSLPAPVGDMRDSSFRETYSIQYYTLTTRDITAAETVNLDVDSDGVDAYPENY